jgi:CubicO group peptidase (beta-lactamase class C family)
MLAHALVALCLLGLEGPRPVAELDAAIDGFLRAESEAKRFSGVVLIARDGQAPVRRAYGMAHWTRGTPNTPETAFLIYSNTKQFTAAAVLMLHDRGKLALDDPIGRYLADCPPEWGPVTIRHLLTHTSGIDIDNLWLWIYNHYPPYREGPALGPYERKALESPPGEKFRYSNGGYMLLAQVVTRASGKDYRQFFAEEIFAPLGMAHTGFDRDQPTPGRARGHDLTGPTPVISEQATHGIAGAGVSTRRPTTSSTGTRPSTATGCCRPGHARRCSGSGSRRPGGYRLWLVHSQRPGRQALPPPARRRRVGVHQRPDPPAGGPRLHRRPGQPPPGGGVAGRRWVPGARQGVAHRSDAPPVERR